MLGERASGQTENLQLPQVYIFRFLVVMPFVTVEIHLIPMDPVALTLKVEQKVALTGLAGLAR